MTDKEFNDRLDGILAWKDAVNKSPHTCPNCGEERQVQIRDAMDQGGPLWKCRMCRHKFHTQRPQGVQFPNTPNTDGQQD